MIIMNNKNEDVNIQEAIKELQDNMNLPWGCSISKKTSEAAVDALKKQISQPLEDGEWDTAYGVHAEDISEQELCRKRRNTAVIVVKN